MHQSIFINKSVIFQGVHIRISHGSRFILELKQIYRQIYFVKYCLYRLEITPSPEIIFFSVISYSSTWPHFNAPLKTPLSLWISASTVILHSYGQRQPLPLFITHTVVPINGQIHGI
jgi:hypothetical protein